MDHVKDVLEHFGKHTRQSDDELLDPSKIAQKYIAVHIGEVAYNGVSNDYKAVGLRTHHPPLKMYAQNGKIDVPTFMEAMQTIGTAAREGDMFVKFQDQFFPQDTDQEKWQWLERPDQWKESAAFVASTLCTSPKFGDIVDQLGMERQPLKVFFQQQDRATQDGIRLEVGSILKRIQMEKGLFLGAPLSLSETNSITTTTPCVKKNLITLDTKGDAPVQSMNLKELRSKMEPYRQRAGLNKTFNTEKLAKQIMVSALNVPEHAVPPSILGTHQKVVMPLVSDEERELASTLVDVFETEPQFDPNKSARCQALSKATLSNMWDPRTMLKHILHAEHHIENGRQLKLYTNSGVDGKEDNELTRAIEKL